MKPKPVASVMSAMSVVSHYPLFTPVTSLRPQRNSNKGARVGGRKEGRCETTDITDTTNVAGRPADEAMLKEEISLWGDEIGKFEP